MVSKAMSTTQANRFIRMCEEQGIKVTRTKKGLFIRFPDGTSTVQHFTNSDVRAEQNQIARFRRAGMVHPNDTRVTQELPSYITNGQISVKTRKILLDYLAKQNYPDSVLASGVVRGTGMDPGQTNRALYHVGLRPGPLKDKRKGREWFLPEELLELRDGEAVKTPLDVALGMAERAKEAESIDPNVGVPDVQIVDSAEVKVREPEPIIERKVEDSVYEDEGPSVEPQVPIVVEGTAEQSENIEFIDERDSWVVDLKDLLGGSAYILDDKLRMLGILGMDYEFRVWRKDGSK